MDHGEGKKPGKFPARAGKPWRAANTDKAAISTLAEALQLRDAYNHDPNRLATVNKNAEDDAAFLKKPFCPILRFEVGFVPRAGSAFVVFDLDDCRNSSTGEITDPEIASILEGYDGYIEPSTSGTGLRLIMPREEGDEALSDRREGHGVGFMAKAEQAKGMALTLRPERLKWSRGAFVVDALIYRRDEGLKAKRTVRKAPTDDVAVEFAHISINDLEEMFAHIENDDRFDERGTWVGIVKAVKEAFEPRGLGEAAWDILDDWTSTRDGNYEPHLNRRVWDEPCGQPGGTTLATLIKFAKEGGWRAEEEPVANPVKPEAGRFCLVGGNYWDRRTYSERNPSEMWRLTFEWDMRDLKGKKIGRRMNDRLGWLNGDLPRFDGKMFAPGRPAEIDDPTGIYINTWEPLVPPVWNGSEPRPWLDHMARIVPDAADREWLVEWMAFVLQNPGRKVNWAPVLIGREGSGKDTLFHPLTKHLGRYAREGLTLQMVSSQFNGWLDRCLLAIVQERQGGRWHDKKDAAERLKPLIAGPPDRIPFERKGVDVTEIDNVVNIAFFVNEADALHIDRDSRRYFPVESDFLPANPERYFRPLWDYLENGGAEQVAAWLLQYPLRLVRERMRVPRASAFERIVEAGLGPAGEEIAACVGEREWVSIDEVRGHLWPIEHIPAGAKGPKAVAEVLRGLGLSPRQERVKFRVAGRSRAVTVCVREGVEVDLDVVRYTLKEAER
ncbi:MAG: DUF5906 domain-containing protein [Paracoccaceae bacterium]|nr:DUF5906 domain-containing protein [Paracoccaceae bacterium]